MGLRFRMDGREDGGSAVSGADSGGYAEPRINGLAEGRTMRGSVNRGHEREMQIVAALFGQREANEAAAVLGHEVDGVGRDFLGGAGPVALVFTVLFVPQYHHA